MGIFSLLEKRDKEFMNRIEYELNFYHKKLIEADKTHYDEAKKNFFDYIEDGEKQCREKGDYYYEWFILQVSKKIRAK